MIGIQEGIVETVLDAVASATGNSNVFALPPKASQITWQSSFGSAPVSITLQLQISLDNNIWSTIDSSTSVSGESKTVNSAALFVRVRINAVSGGSGITVKISCKSGIIAAGNATFDNLTIDGNLVVGGSLSLGTPYNPFDQDLNTTDDVEFNSLIAAGLTYPTIDGTNGQALVTNGSGLLSFATISGGNPPFTLPPSSVLAQDGSANALIGLSSDSELLLSNVNSQHAYNELLAGTPVDIIADQEISGTLPHVPIVPGTFRAVPQGNSQTVTDDGSGNIAGAIGSGGTNTIDYVTGAYSFSYAADEIGQGPVRGFWRAPGSDPAVIVGTGDGGRFISSAGVGATGGAWSGLAGNGLNGDGGAWRGVAGAAQVAAHVGGAWEGSAGNGVAGSSGGDWLARAGVALGNDNNGGNWSAFAGDGQDGGDWRAESGAGNAGDGGAWIGKGGNGVDNGGPIDLIAGAASFGLDGILTFSGAVTIPNGRAAVFMANISVLNATIFWRSTNSDRSGNAVQIEYVDPMDVNQALSATYVAPLLTIHLATDGGGAITTTAQDVVNLGSYDSAPVTAAVPPFNDGTGVLAAMSPTNLSGGLSPFNVTGPSWLDNGAITTDGSGKITATGLFGMGITACPSGQTAPVTLSVDDTGQIIFTKGSCS